MSASTLVTDPLLGLVFGTLAGCLGSRFAVLLHLNNPANSLGQEGS
ncbi:hypothetical protein ACQEWB_44730 [Streptomyces sp. CA-249302]